MKAPYCLMSLRDMLELPIGRLLSMYHHLSVMGQVLSQLDRAQLSFKFPDKDYEALHARAEEFSNLCQSTSLDLRFVSTDLTTCRRVFKSLSKHLSRRYAYCGKEILF
jgi:hypothetical protein